MKCAKCGKEKLEDSPMCIIEKGVANEKGHAVFQDYCFDCGMEELRSKLKGVPITIEIPHYPGYTAKELLEHGAAINYTAELIDYPPPK